MDDVSSDYAGFDQVRERVKVHLGREFFFDPTGQVTQYKAPEFHFERMGNWQAKQR